MAGASNSVLHAIIENDLPRFACPTQKSCSLEVSVSSDVFWCDLDIVLGCSKGNTGDGSCKCDILGSGICASPTCIAFCSHFLR